MPYYRCPGCELTTHSVAGRFTRNICPNCSAPLDAGDRVHVDECHPPVIRRGFPLEPDSAAAARRELETLSWALDSEEAYVLALLVTELVTNSIQHAPGDDDGSVVLEVRVSDELVRVRVRDDGSGFRPAARTDDSPIDSHWGLYLVDELADRWEVSAAPSTVVSFELDRVAAVSAAPLEADDAHPLRAALVDQGPVRRRVPVAASRARVHARAS